MLTRKIFFCLLVYMGSKMWTALVCCFCTSLHNCDLIFDKTLKDSTSIHNCEQLFAVPTWKQFCYFLLYVLLKISSKVWTEHFWLLYYTIFTTIVQKNSLTKIHFSSRSCVTGDTLLFKQFTIVNYLLSPRLFNTILSLSLSLSLSLLDAGQSFFHNRAFFQCILRCLPG